jgi:hypothetical protein
LVWISLWLTAVLDEVDGASQGIEVQESDR